MNHRERILGVLRGERVDKIPWVHYDRHFPRGEKEREIRNLGMGLCCSRPCFFTEHPNVEIVQSTKPGGVILRTYHTPLGSLTEKLKVGVGYGKARYGRDWKGHVPRIVEYLIKKPEDYEVMKFIVEDTEYKPYYEAIEDAERHLGGDGIVQVNLGYSPLQTIIIELTGVERFYIDYARHREKVLELYDVLDRKYEEKYRIAAKSPGEFFLYGDNIDGFLISPSFFERYCIPAYNKCARELHSTGRILGVHMDGRLKSLANLIGKAEIDVIEAFTPPPMGDLPIREARSLWKDKIIWMNYPSSVYVMGPPAVRRHLINLLESVIPGDRLLITASTENVIEEEALLAATEILAEATLPLTEEKVKEIERKIPAERSIGSG